MAEGIPSPPREAESLRLSAIEARLAAIESRLADAEGLDWIVPPAGVTLGERIRRQRKALGLTQERLAPALGVDQSTVAKWEGGNRMDLERLPAIARFLLCPVEELLLDYLREWD